MLKASKYEAGHKIRFLRVVVDYDVDRPKTLSHIGLYFSYSVILTLPINKQR